MIKRITQPADEFGDAIKYYEERLSQPAPTEPPYTRTADGQYWLLPETTIGWQVLAWVATAQPDVKLSDTAARIVLWHFAVDEKGERAVWRYGLSELDTSDPDVRQAREAISRAYLDNGPCRFAEFDHNGEPLATVAE